MSLGREGSIPSLSIGLKNMRDPALDSILNPPNEEIHTTECSWHRDWHACDCGTFDDMSARSSVEEQGPSKPKVVGSTPTRCVRLIGIRPLIGDFSNRVSSPLRDQTLVRFQIERPHSVPL